MSGPASTMRIFCKLGHNWDPYRNYTHTHTHTHARPRPRSRHSLGKGITLSVRSNRENAKNRKLVIRY